MSKTNVNRPLPGPLVLLLLLREIANGKKLSHVAKQSGYNIESMRRWGSQHAADVATFDEWVRRHNIDLTGHTLDEMFPPNRPRLSPSFAQGNDGSYRPFMTKFGEMK